MWLRKTVKKFVYRYIPGVSGAFPYFGTRVFFPKDAFIFDLVCEEGIYEGELLRQIRGVVRPESWYFDVGANIGLMSVPILQMAENVRVVSFEPSSNSWPCLEKTWRHCPWKDRWKIVRKAVSDHVGEERLFRSAKRFGGYDGLRNTKRAPNTGTEKVPVTTLDEEWNRLGCPSVTCLKLDVEGAELEVLSGARDLIRSAAPHVFLEWYEENFRCFGREAQDLLRMADELEYDVISIPNLNVIRSSTFLSLHMRVSASFVLMPRVPQTDRLHPQPDPGEPTFGNSAARIPQSP